MNRLIKTIVIAVAAAALLTAITVAAHADGIKATAKFNAVDVGWGNYIKTVELGMEFFDFLSARVGIGDALDERVIDVGIDAKLTLVGPNFLYVAPFIGIGGLTTHESFDPYLTVGGEFGATNGTLYFFGTVAANVHVDATFVVYGAGVSLRF
jgi:hypothetical protein